MKKKTFDQSVHVRIYVDHWLNPLWLPYGFTFTQHCKTHEYLLWRTKLNRLTTKKLTFFFEWHFFSENDSEKSDFPQAIFPFFKFRLSSHFLITIILLYLLLYYFSFFFLIDISSTLYSTTFFYRTFSSILWAKNVLQFLLDLILIVSFNFPPNKKKFIPSTTFASFCAQIFYETCQSLSLIINVVSNKTGRLESILSLNQVLYFKFDSRWKYLRKWLTHVVAISLK